MLVGSVRCIASRKALISFCGRLESICFILYSRSSFRPLGKSEEAFASEHPIQTSCLWVRFVQVSKTFIAFRGRLARTRTSFPYSHRMKIQTKDVVGRVSSRHLKPPTTHGWLEHAKASCMLGSSSSARLRGIFLCTAVQRFAPTAESWLFDAARDMPSSSSFEPKRVPHQASLILHLLS